MAEALVQESTSLNHDETRFSRLFVRHQDQLFIYICSLVPHRSDAEDIFQRCSATLWRRFLDFESADSEGSFLSWAYMVAYNEVRNFLKFKRRNRISLDPELVEQLAEDAHAELQETFDRMEALKECVACLEPASRELLAAAYESSSSVVQLAGSRGQALQTLYNRLARIRKGLLACVERRLAERFHHDE